MSGFRYKQYCPLARAAEVLGERWTLLVIRELLIGPIRFSDLRRRLSQVSPSVLSTRVQGLEARGLIERRELPPPASVSVLELTDFGQSLRAVVLEMTRFGVQLLGPPEPEDHFEPTWLRIGLHAVTAATESPDLHFALTIEDGERNFVLEIFGGPEGTSVRDVPDGDVPGADARIRGEGLVVLALASGSLAPNKAIEDGMIEFSGRLSDLEQFPRLFQFGGASRPAP